MNNVIFNPYNLMESKNKKKLAVIIVSSFLLFTQILVNINFFNSDVLKQMTDEIEDIPYWLFVTIMVFIQLFFTFVNLILISLIFKLVTKFLIGKLSLLTILYIVYIGQIPVFIGMILNSFFVNIDDTNGLILSVTGLGYVASFFTSNNLTLSILNSLDLFDLWTAIVISNGIYFLSNNKSFKKVFLIVFITYFIVKICNNLLF